MVFRFQYPGRRSQESLFIELDARNYAFTLGKDELFEKQVVPPAALRHKWIGIKTVARRAQHVKGFQIECFRSAHPGAHGDKPLLTEAKPTEPEGEVAPECANERLGAVAVIGRAIRRKRGRTRWLRGGSRTGMIL